MTHNSRFITFPSLSTVSPLKLELHVQRDRSRVASRNSFEKWRCQHAALDGPLRMIEHVVDIDIDCHSGTVIILIPSIAAVPAVAAAKPKPIVTPLIVVAEAAVAAKVATAAIAAVITALGLGE